MSTKIDWNIVAAFASPIIALLAGIFIDRWFRERPRLMTYLGHASAFKVRLEDGVAFDVHTHAIVIRNTGRRVANNVRISHGVFPPNVTVFPAIDYRIVELPDGGKDLVLSAIVPGEQITVTYLYYPPVTWAQVNTFVKFDEGYARTVTAIPSVQQPSWLRLTTGALALVGALTLLYLFWHLIATWQNAGPS